MSRMADCHPDRPHKARGLCKPCWSREQRGAPTSILVARPVPAATGGPAVTAKPKPQRVARGATGGLNGPGVCPTHPHHGTVYVVFSDGRLWCSHQEHEGHKDRPATRSVFTLQEVEAARQAVHA